MGKGKELQDGTLCQRTQVINVRGGTICSNGQSKMQPQSALVKSKDSGKSVEIEVKEPESHRVCWTLTTSGTVTGLSWEEAIRPQAKD